MVRIPKLLHVETITWTQCIMQHEVSIAWKLGEFLRINSLLFSLKTLQNLMFSKKNEVN